MYIAPARYICVNYLIKLCIINVNLSKLNRQHAAADIDSDDVRNNLLAKVCSESNDAACAGMDIWHYTDFAVGEHFDGKQSLNLIRCNCSALRVQNAPHSGLRASETLRVLPAPENAL